jgi:UDP-glucose 4-epimerase
LARFLVTGGAGFIASNVCDKLIDSGHEVAIVDNLSTGRRENINPKAAFYEVDITDEPSVAEVFDEFKPEYVDHHAAQMDVRRSTREPAFDAKTNVIGSIFLITNALRVGVKKFIYASTGGALFGEPEYLPVDEKHPVNPISQYGITKHTVEHYLFLYKYNNGLDYTILRYPNVFGPRQDPHGEAGVIAIFSELMLEGKRPTIFGDGKSTRDYVHVQDIVAANMIAVEKGSGQAYNLGWGREVSVQEIFDTLARALDYKEKPIYAESRVGEIGRICLCADKARAELGWSPTYDLESGVAQTVAYYRGLKGGGS